MTKKLLVAISFHGFGHIAQTAPVLNLFHERNPQVAITLLSAAPLDLLQQHFHFAFEHVQEALDFGMVQSGALDVRVEESYQQYRQLHEHWEESVTRWKRYLETAGIDLVFANVPYLILEAAHAAGIPCVALCSLNWLDIVQAYCAEQEGAEIILQQIRNGYNRAEVFLLPQPSMPMPQFHRTRNIGPIARVGWNRKDEICAKLGITTENKLVLFTLGGTQTELDIHTWPQYERLHYLVQTHHDVGRDDIHNLYQLHMPFEDLIASCDAFVVKPGYGSFAESACNAASVLYVRRPGWPEEPYLVEWLNENVHCLEITRTQMESGNLHAALEKLWSGERKQAVLPTGILQAVEVLEGYLKVGAA